MNTGFWTMILDCWKRNSFFFKSNFETSLQCMMGKNRKLPFGIIAETLTRPMYYLHSRFALRWCCDSHRSRAACLLFYENERTTDFREPERVMLRQFDFFLWLFFILIIPPNRLEWRKCVFKKKKSPKKFFNNSLKSTLL